MPTYSKQAIAKESQILIWKFLNDPDLEQTYASLLGNHELCFPLDIFSKDNKELLKIWKDTAEGIVQKEGFTNTCLCPVCILNEKTH